MNFLSELNDEYLHNDAIPLIGALEEAIGVMNAQSRGGIVKNKIAGAAGFFKKNPAVTIAAATLALNSYTKYKANKRDTIKLFAKDAYERKMMTSVVDALTNSRKFKIVKTKYADGGRYWILKRV